jgi:hypothetical protein
MAVDLRMNPKNEDVLLNAYGPCPAFTVACSEMRWDPARRHVPGGSLGGTCNISRAPLKTHKEFTRQ